jgi:hypothetical protein
MLIFSKTADLSWLVIGGQPYRAFPFSKGSLVEATDSDQTNGLLL